MLVRQDRAQRNAKAEPSACEKEERVALQESFCGACFESGDERPQLVDGFGHLAGSAGDVGEPEYGFGELEHRGEGRVVGLGDSQRVGRHAERVGDVAEGAGVRDDATAGLDHRDIGLVVAEDPGYAFLAQPVELPVGSQDLGKVPRPQRAARFGA